MKPMILPLKGLQKVQVLVLEAQSFNKSMLLPGHFKSKIITTVESSLEKFFSKSKKQSQRNLLVNSRQRQAQKTKEHKWAQQFLMLNFSMKTTKRIK